MAGRWGGSEEQTRRIGDKKMIFREVYQKLNEWHGRWAACEDTIPLRRNEDWPMGDQSSPIRNIAAQICWIGHENLGKYLGDMQDIGGVLASAKPRGPGKMNVEDLAIRGFNPGWGLCTMWLEGE